MRRIKKGPEPVCLEQVRQTPGVNWNSASGKQEMRDHLWAEQKGLCAYCMSRLPAPSAEAMKIEHYVARAKDKTHWFSWANLLGVCLGDIGIEGIEDRYHCDTHRGHLSTDKQELHVHPAQFPPDAGTLFSYTDAGEIRPAKHLDEGQRTRIAETIDRLNLNIERLKRNREKVRAVARKMLQEGKVTQRRVSELLADARRLDDSGRLNEYAEVAIQYFEKKLRQVGSAS